MTALAQFEAALARALQAGLRGVVVVTDEEQRALASLEQIARALAWPSHTWSAAVGVDADGKRRGLAEVLGALRGQGDDALWIVFDGGAALDAIARRALREAAQRVDGPAIVLVEPTGGDTITQRIPELARLELPSPDAAELEVRVAEVGAALERGGWAGARERLIAASRPIVRAALGLPLHAFERLLAEAVLVHGLDPAAIARFVRAAKPQTLAGSGLLESVAGQRREAVGGLEGFLHWLAQRRASFEPEAAAWGVRPARGCLLVGVQGCGKSLAARVCAHELDLPLVRLEPGRLFGGTVGESEGNLRRALAEVDRMAPAVLWIDELDKGFAGAEGAASDAGTAARVLGGLLTWLQERTRPVFVVATANRVELLPAELLRRGRLDEIFFVDLPGASEREAIARVHVGDAPTQAQPPADALDELLAVARAAEGYSGAELAAAVAEARLAAFGERRALLAADLRTAIDAMIPLSVLRAEDVERLRRWAERRARRA